MWKYNL